MARDREFILFNYGLVLFFNYIVYVSNLQQLTETDVNILEIMTYVGSGLSLIGIVLTVTLYALLT